MNGGRAALNGRCSDRIILTETCSGNINSFSLMLFIDIVKNRDLCQKHMAREGTLM